TPAGGAPRRGLFLHQYRSDPEESGRAFRHSPRGHDQQTAPREYCLSPSGRHVPRPATDRKLAQHHWGSLRRPRPRHRSARLSPGQGSDGNRPERPPGGQLPGKTIAAVIGGKFPIQNTRLQKTPDPNSKHQRNPNAAIPILERWCRLEAWDLILPRDLELARVRSSARLSAATTVISPNGSHRSAG